MARTPIHLYKQFNSRCKELENTRSHCENAFTKQILTPDDIYSLYGGLFLDVFTEFELVLEILFVGLFSRDYKSSISGFKIRAKVIPKHFAKELVFSGKNYLDWLPYPEYTLKRARLYFDSPHPFEITDTEKEIIDRYHKIRNALAHKSQKAMNDFAKILPQGLLPIEKTPSGYLRSKPSSTNNQTQFEIAVIELNDLTRKLCQ